MKIFKIVTPLLLIYSSLFAEKTILIKKNELQERIQKNFTQDSIIGFKYLSLNDNLKNTDFISGKRDKEVFHYWLNHKQVSFSIVSNVTDQFAVRSFSTFYRPICIDQLKINKDIREEKRDKKENIATCIILSPTIPQSYKVKTFKYSNVNRRFDITPVMFIINKKIGIIVFDIFNDQYIKEKNLTKEQKLTLLEINNVFLELSKKTGISLKNMIAVGNFGVNKKTLEKFIRKKLEVLIDKATLIKKIDKKYVQRNTEHIIKFKESDFLKNPIVDYSIAFLKKEYMTKNKKENMKRFYKKVNHSMPLKFFIKYDFTK